MSWLTRRQLLRRGAALAALTAGAPWTALRDLLAAGDAALGPVVLPQGLKVLSREEWLTIAYVSNSIFPETEETPSAVNVGVLQFMSRSLEGYSRWERGVYSTVAQGLRKAAGGDFAALNEDQRARCVLEWLGSLDEESRKQFQRIARHCIEGYLSRPSHGGNTHGTGWKAIRFTPQTHGP